MKVNLIKRLLQHRLMDRAWLYLKESHLYSEEHWCRVIMNRETRKLVMALDINHLDVLEISGTYWRSMPFRSYKSVGYPEFDICSPPSGISIDMVIAEQVFEHLLYPYKAGKAMYELLRPEGYILITTPFLIKIHDAPVDCTRWTETGIKYFLAECGFSLQRIRTGSWGNKKCIVSNFNRWSRYKKWINSLDNEKDFPMVVWALAQK